MSNLTDKQNKFEEGSISYKVKSGLDINAVAAMVGTLSGWSDGYLAFSNVEHRLDDTFRAIDIGSLLSGRYKNNGYVMEVGLWREDDETSEEIYIEREDNGFHTQRWILYKQSQHSGHDSCYYRLVDTLWKKHIKTFEKTQAPSAYEVVVSEKRLHFFLTRTVK